MPQIASLANYFNGLGFPASKSRRGFSSSKETVHLSKTPRPFIENDCLTRVSFLIMVFMTHNIARDQDRFFTNKKRSVPRLRAIFALLRFGVVRIVVYLCSYLEKRARRLCERAKSPFFREEKTGFTREFQAEIRARFLIFRRPRRRRAASRRCRVLPF